MTWFALTLYAYQKTGQATTLSLMGFFHFLPLILLSPLAGALVDRYLMLLLFGSLGVLLGLSGYLLPRVREAASLLPDAKEDQAPAP